MDPKWVWSEAMMPDRDEPDCNIERVARELAANAGYVWEQLALYPGFLRNRFRQDARKMLGRFSAPMAA